MVQKYPKAERLGEKHKVGEDKERRGFLKKISPDLSFPQWEMNLVNGAFSSHPSSRISWTMLLRVQWQLSKHGA